MNREDFSNLLRDLLANIHDYAVLEKHPFYDLLPRPEGSRASISRVERIRRFIQEGVEMLKPVTPAARLDSTDWRYYQILYGRYVEGASVLDLQNRLALGERQARRLHGRALSVLEEILWNRLFPEQVAGETTGMAVSTGGLVEDAIEEETFQIKLEPLRLNQVLDEVLAVSATRMQSLGVRMEVQIPTNLPMILSDRIILRQILLQLVSRALLLLTGGDLKLNALPDGEDILLELELKVDELELGDILPASTAEAFVSHGPFQYWLERVGARLSVEMNKLSQGEVLVQVVLRLPRANQSKILVVDDHEPAIRIIQRYLNSTNVQTVGLTDPTKVLPMLQTLRPQAVLLDVMMPNTDGWELLQAIKADPETQKIQVVICSVWNEPELAFSLGANGFLKKPISQADLLEMLMRLNLLDTSDELPVEGL